MKKDTYFCYSFRVVVYDFVMKYNVIHHPVFDTKLPISCVARLFNVSPDCVTRSMPRLVCIKDLPF